MTYNSNRNDAIRTNVDITDTTKISKSKNDSPRRRNTTPVFIMLGGALLYLILLLHSIALVHAISDDQILMAYLRKTNKINIGPLTIKIFDAPSTGFDIDAMTNVTYNVLHDYFAYDAYPQYYDNMDITLSDQQGIFKSGQSSLFHVFNNAVTVASEQHYGSQFILTGWIALVDADTVDATEIDAQTTFILNDTSRYLYSIHQLNSTEFENVNEAIVVEPSTVVSSNATATLSPTSISAAPALNPHKPSLRPITSAPTRNPLKPTRRPIIAWPPHNPPLKPVRRSMPTKPKPTHRSQKPTRRPISTAPTRRSHKPTRRPITAAPSSSPSFHPTTTIPSKVEISSTQSDTILPSSKVESKPSPTRTNSTGHSITPENGTTERSFNQTVTGPEIANSKAMIFSITGAALIVLSLIGLAICLIRPNGKRNQTLSSIPIGDEVNKISPNIGDENTYSSCFEKDPVSWEDWGFSSEIEDYQQQSTPPGVKSASDSHATRHHEDDFQADFSQVVFDDAIITEPAGSEINDNAQIMEHPINNVKDHGDWAIHTNFVLESPPRCAKEAADDQISYISSPGHSTLAFSIASSNLDLESSAMDLSKKCSSLFRRPLSKLDGSFPTTLAGHDNPYFLDRRNGHDYVTPHPYLSNDRSQHFSSDQSSACDQSNALHPLDWSNGESSTIDFSSSDMGSSANDLQGKRIWDEYLLAHHVGASPTNALYSMPNQTNYKSSTYNNNCESPVSEASFSTGVSSTTAGSDISRSKELIQDILWLEKKIADRTADPGTLASEDNFSQYCSEDNNNDLSNNAHSMQRVQCRDCFAPPGKLHIIIRSSVDGPVVHTVNESSVLYDQLVKGDLIIAVDDVDTRNMRAEAVMQLMHSKIDLERKITVLRFSEHA